MFLNLTLLFSIVITLHLILEYKWGKSYVSKYGFSGKAVERLEKINQYYNLGGRVQLDDENKIKLRKYNLMKERDKSSE